MFQRYAIYHTPDAGSPLAEFGASWLGWDSAGGQEVAHPDVGGLDVAAITETPRKYGFHATIKPPFRLAEGQTEAALKDALAALCTQAAPVRLDALVLTRLGRFFALVPEGPTDALGALAGRTVQALDMYRAPATEAELTRRRAARLTPEQDALLVRWGYPYVMEAFRFHMTLTGRLDAETSGQTRECLERLLADIALRPYDLASLTLLGADGDGRFHQIARYALGG